MTPSGRQGVRDAEIIFLEVISVPIGATNVTKVGGFANFFRNLFGRKASFQVAESLGAAATRISVRGGGFLAEGSQVAGISRIASGRGIREVSRLVTEYGGQTRHWIKKKGFAEVQNSSGVVRRAEVHWYEAHGVGRVEFKVKSWLD